MNSLAKLAIDAHGGLDRRKKFETVSAHIAQGGVLGQIKGHVGTLAETNGAVRLLSEWSSLRQSFAGHTAEAPWTRLPVAYFAGYAMWT